MATVLAYTSPALGHLFPMTPLLLELRRRGHDVHVRTLEDQVDRLRELGLEAAPIDGRSREIIHPDWEASNPKEALLVAIRTFCDRARVDGPDMAAAVDAVRPDLLVVDINAWGAMSVAEASGIPWVLFSPYTPPLRAQGVPPFGPGLAPRPGPVGAIRDALVRPLVIGVAERSMRPRINELRAGHGLPPVRTADDFFRRSSELMLVATAEPFEYPHPDWTGDVLMIGACEWEPPVAPPAWLDDVDRPLVLVTTSSEYQADEQLVRTAFEALADEDVTVVATMPAGLADVDVPANGRLEEFVPHGPVLDRAALAITHGGMGATQKALARGVPVCVVPFGRDQLEVAARVVHSGAGTRVPVKRLSPERLRSAALGAMRCTDGARRVAAGYAAAGGAVAGADAIEARLLGRPAGRVSPS